MATLDLARLVADARAAATIRLPAGRIVLDAPLVLRRAVTLVGKKTTIAGKTGAAVLVVEKGARAKLQGVEIVREGTQEGDVIRCLGHLTLTSCTVRGGRKKRTSSGGIGLWLGGSAKAALDRCAFVDHAVKGVEASGRSLLFCKRTTFENGGVGVHTDERARSTLEGNSFADLSEVGVVFSGQAAGLAKGNRFVRTGNALSVRDKSAPTLTANRCQSSHDVGIWIAESARPIVVNNVVEGSGDDAIALHDRCKATLRDNRLVRSKADGISVMESAEVVAEGNVVEGCAGDGVFLADRARGRFRKNRITGNESNGFRLDDAASPVLEDNHVARNEGAGVLVTDRAKPTLRGNVVEANDGAGIEYWNQAAGVASKNVCRKNGDSGILMSGGVSPTLVANECLSNDGRGIAQDEDTGGKLPRPTLRDNVCRDNSDEGGRGTQASFVQLSRKLAKTPLAPYVRRAWVPTTRPGDGGPGASKFGGTPCLGPDEAWPSCGECSKPMALILQLDLQRLPKGAPRAGRGLLQLFFCREDGCSDGAAFYLLRIAPKRARPQSVRVPKMKDRFPPKLITGFHDHGELARCVGLKDTERRRIARGASAAGFAYWDGDEDVGAGPDASAAGGDKLLGWACWIHDPPKMRCPKCKAAMRPLFQIDSETNVPFAWGDAGKAWVMQCPTHHDELTLEWQCH